jgi:hypothetical protein
MKTSNVERLEYDLLMARHQANHNHEWLNHWKNEIRAIKAKLNSAKKGRKKL